MLKYTHKLKSAIYYIVAALVIYTLGMNFIYLTQHPEKTEMQSLYRTHKNFIWDFED